MKALGYALAFVGGIGTGFGIVGILSLLAIGLGTGTRLASSTLTFAVTIAVGGIVVGGAGEVIRRRAKRNAAMTTALHEEEHPVIWS
jgi:hypothetical protein